MIELERSGRGPSAVRPVATNSQHLSSQVISFIEIFFPQLTDMLAHVAKS